MTNGERTERKDKWGQTKRKENKKAELCRFDLKLD